MIGIGIGSGGKLVAHSYEDDEVYEDLETPVGWKVYETPRAMITMAFNTLEEAQRFKAELRADGFSGRIKAVYEDGEQRDLWDLR